jgi:hypothetical protein
MSLYHIAITPNETKRRSDWWHDGKTQRVVPQSIYPNRVDPSNDLADTIAFQPSHGYSAGVALSELLDFNRGLKDPKKVLLVDTSERDYIQLYIHVELPCGFLWANS